ncbi:MAG: hypothetical protein IJU84_10235 [Clostridia bacterium]|nr:hypothetical protein [Clostridia bacterium]MBQ9482520.1 hypothetical protein [Clostridia bacterium]
MIKVACFGIGKFTGFIDKFFQAVWTVIRRLNLQLLLTVAVVWLIVAAFGGMTFGVLIVFTVLAGLALAYAIIATAYNLVKYIREAPAEKSKKKPSVKDIPEDGKTENGPVYYRVAQNPRYVMAEYPDRYELYFDNDGELELVKITLRTGENEKDDGNLQ